LCLDACHAIADVLSPKSHSVAATKSGVQQHGYPHRCRDPRGQRLVGDNVLLGPNRETFDGPELRIFDQRRWIRFQVLRMFGPFEEAAYRVEKVTSLKRRFGSAVAAGSDRRRSDVRNRLIAGCFKTCRRMFSRCLLVARESEVQEVVSR
jgi:hypothetical protein